MMSEKLRRWSNAAWVSVVVAIFTIVAFRPAASPPATVHPATMPKSLLHPSSAAAEGQSAATAATKPSTSSSLRVGERVKITFFEMLDVEEKQSGVTGRERAESNLHTFYQRMDLTGDYAVQPDGSIMLPRLGTFAIAGKEPQVVQAQLAVAFQREMGRTANVSVVVTERLPIYIVGPVKNPGSYKHVPGMMVLYGVALAGGFDRSLLSLSEQINRLHEHERLQKAETRLGRLLARRARLVAERDKVPTIAAPERLISLIGETRAGELVAEEAALRTLAIIANRAEAETLRLGIATAETELKGLRRQLPQFDEQVELRNGRLKDVQSLSAQGYVMRKDLISVKSDIMDFDNRREQTLVLVSQAERKLAQAEQVRAKFEVDGQLRLQQELIQVEQEIDEAGAILASAGSIAGIMEYATGAMVRDEERTVAYEIVRRDPGGTRVLVAEETSDLEPGDVLRITMNRDGKRMVRPSVGH